MIKNVLSLFDGHSGLQIALNESKIPYENYYASEIDKYAVQVTQAIYPNTKQLGSVLDWKKWDIKNIDLISCGFPCQPYSIAGNRKGLEDDRGGDLVNAMFDIIDYYRPRYFLLENVKGILSINKGAVFKYVLNRLEKMGYPTDWLIINSALVSAQNRERVYITNIPGSKKTLLGNVISQPEDKGILLEDIIENNPPATSYLKPKMIAWLKRHSKKRGTKININREKTGCLTATAQVKGNLTTDFIDQSKFIVKEATKKGEGIKVECIQSGDTKNTKTIDVNRRIYSEKGKCPTLMASGREDTIKKIGDSLTWRKLTPRECARLQTILENIIDIMLNCGV